MTDKEKEDLGRREVLRKFAAATVVVPALQALAACGGDGATGANPTALPAASNTAGAGAAPPASSATAMSAAAAKPSTPATPAATPMPSAAMPAPSPAMQTMPATPAAPAAPAAPGNSMMPAAGTPVDFAALDCVATPDLTEGPFFIDNQIERSDLLEGETEATVTAGLPVELTLGVFKVSGGMCSPFIGAQVDVWHADTQGTYSAVAGGFIQSMDTSDKKFLRGWQKVGEDGVVKFKTIWPGWYGSRAIHIHFKIRMQGQANSSMVFNSQFFFDDDLNAKVLAEPGYKAGPPPVTNRMDQVFTNTGPGCCPTSMPPPPDQHVPGEETVLQVMPADSGKGYKATYKIGLMMA